MKTPSERAAEALTGGDKLYIHGNGWCDPDEIAALIEHHTLAGEMERLLVTVLHEQIRWQLAVDIRALLAKLQSK